MISLNEEWQNLGVFFPNKHLAQIQSKARCTWMILDSSSKEFLQSPQYSWANCRMYLFTLAEVELIPPLLPDSSCNGESKEESQREAITKITTAEQHLRQGLPWAEPRPACAQPELCEAAPGPAYLGLLRGCLVHFAQEVLQLWPVSHQLVIHPVSLVQQSVDVCHCLPREKETLFHFQNHNHQAPSLFFYFSLGEESLNSNAGSALRSTVVT